MFRGVYGIATVALGVAAVVCIPVGISLFPTRVPPSQRMILGAT
jgi:hypothetical protein